MPVILKERGFTVTERWFDEVEVTSELPLVVNQVPLLHYHLHPPGILYQELSRLNLPLSTSYNDPTLTFLATTVRTTQHLDLPGPPRNPFKGHISQPELLLETSHTKPTLKTISDPGLAHSFTPTPTPTPNLNSTTTTSFAATFSATTTILPPLNSNHIASPLPKTIGLDFAAIKAELAELEGLQMKGMDRIVPAVEAHRMGLDNKEEIQGIQQEEQEEIVEFGPPSSSSASSASSVSLHLPPMLPSKSPNMGDFSFPPTTLPYNNNNNASLVLLFYNPFTTTPTASFLTGFTATTSPSPHPHLTLVA
ncbi:hypothetical protein F5051DRAFT_441570 [Lentinula edodes]|nr:hypothetical protein F5051DRAFT_441570 [Lentinula edodes]